METNRFTTCPFCQSGINIYTGQDIKCQVCGALGGDFGHIISWANDNGELMVTSATKPAEGTLEYRWDKLREYTEREFGHPKYSSKPFEQTLIEGINELKTALTDMTDWIRYFHLDEKNPNFGQVMKTAKKLVQKFNDDKGHIIR